MSGVIGLDLQHFRSLIGLREGDGAHGLLVPVGDGTRCAVPNACDDEGRWGSAAAEALLAARGDTGPPAHAAIDLLCWRKDPWTQPFLRGVHQRLTNYLGQVEPVPRNGYQVVLNAPEAPTGTGGEAAPTDLRERCAAAGLCDVKTVDPTDALLCRWLTEPDPGAGQAAESAAVVAVACGETWTSAAAYSVNHGRVRRLHPNTETIAAGSGTWCTELARQVLDRCRPGVPRTAVLALLDGVGEFATGLRLSDPDRAVPWAGPLADRMYTPLQLTRRELLARQDVRAVTSAVAALVGRAVTVPTAAGRDVGRPLIVVGGIGAVWPVFGDVLSAQGTVWHSAAPDLDLAAGAACWPFLQRRFDTAHPAARLRASPGSPQTIQARQLTEPHMPTPRREEVPPWLRP
ncbi:hypothetical protein ACWGI0_05955 [Streptomyces sp. NPDC054802]